MSRFIVLDGPDGSGTTLHTRFLTERLQKIGRDVLLTAEPTDGPIGTWIRSELTSGNPLPPATLQMLFTADRAWHVDTVIRPAIDAGKTIVCDRYASSTVAYGDALGLDAQWLAAANGAFLKPDLLIFALPSLDVCMERLARRKSRDVMEGRELQARVHAAYHRLASEDPSIKTVDTSGSKEDGSEKIWSLVSAAFGL